MKAGSGESKSMEAVDGNNDGKLVQATMEVAQEKVEDQSGKANAGPEGEEMENGSSLQKKRPGRRNNNS